MKAPPPPDSTMMAKNLGLTAQKELSHVTLETRMSSYIWSAFTGCPKTCRNLLWRTTRRLMAGGARGQAVGPPPKWHGGVLALPKPSAPRDPSLSRVQEGARGHGDGGDGGVEGGTGWSLRWSWPCNRDLGWPRCTQMGAGHGHPGA